MEFDRAFLSTKFKASGPTKFNDNELRGTEFGMQGSAAERKILTAHEILMAHGILKFKDTSAR
ncbi:hypothetical protein [uncultured Campylobacter sp.]|uniref:hypothetical protein n=1 Tax=uncultured Campylobacter sp. TaxID=218934 RepID=UPI002626BA21|nr:hypothetical protein [uncultured Campylobacter sp.]